MESTTHAERDTDCAALVARARGGDVTAFESLHRAYRGRVFGICIRMAQSRDEAEGWSQDVWVRTWERLDTFRGESAFSSWLHRLAVNLILDRKRSAARRRGRIALMDPEDAPTVGMRPGPREEMIDLERAVKTLPDGARTVFLLHDVEGYKHREIAESLGIAVGTVKAQLHRARRLLREALRR